MTNEQFAKGLKENIDRVREYQLGMDGTGGKCDCIGLIIGAIRLAGGKWTGTHGSNYAARNEMLNFQPIPSASALRLNDLVFKHRQPGAEDYALPSSYKGHPDQNDYYHVGVVTSVTPLVITHCTGVAGGIKKDTALGKWSHFGTWKGIENEVCDTRPYTVTGGRLKVRSAPGEKTTVIGYLENGETVQGAVHNADWVYVPEKRGYCMAKYLQPVHPAPLQRLFGLLQECQNLLLEMGVEE
ncbi:MAG: SH3 domain-containing protein [Clostridia bacterium]|nr:SH3 domain-containing protein [Clostridia bacterium]